MTLAEIAARHDIARREECSVPLSIAALICDDVPELIGWVRRLVALIERTPVHPPECAFNRLDLVEGEEVDCTCDRYTLLAEVRG